MSNNINNWIPITERFPETHGYYLVTCRGGNVRIEFYWADDETWQNDFGYEVQAWQPLPEPYKETLKGLKWGDVEE